MKKPCKFCGKLIDEDSWDICDDCIEKSKTFKVADHIGRCWKEEVKINGFLANCFDEDEIEQILYNYFNSLDEDKKQELINQYCEFDMLYFVSWVVKTCKNEK